MSSHSQDDAPAPPATGFSSLAPELTRLLFKHAGKKELKNWRQVSRLWNTFASEELFREIRLCPLEESIEHWNAILNNETIRRLPRRVTIQTRDDLEDDESYDYELSEELVAAIASIPELPNVVELELCFSPRCIGDVGSSRWRLNRVADSVALRKDLLSRTFTIIKRRAADKENQTIRSLVITNLQNYPLPDFTASELFHDVMKDVNQLNLELIIEHNQHGPDHDYSRVELLTFPRHLCTDWLAPIAHNLKVLTLGMESENWGPFPGYFAPSDLLFPNLKTLHLRYYTLAHDGQLDWVLAQKSLKTLVLQNCMIVARLRVDPENFRRWKLKTHDWQPFPAAEAEDNDEFMSFKYESTWATVFDKITALLPNLVSFKFNYNSGLGWISPRHLLKSVASNKPGSRMFPERYVVFDNGILPTHWPEADREGIMHSWDQLFPNFHKDRLQEDQRGLDALLKRCRTRAGGK